MLSVFQKRVLCVIGDMSATGNHFQLAGQSKVAWIRAAQSLKRKGYVWKGVSWALTDKGKQVYMQLTDKAI